MFGNIDTGPACETSPADRKSTRLNSSHLGSSYAVFCLKKKRAHSYNTASCTLIGLLPLAVVNSLRFRYSLFCGFGGMCLFRLHHTAAKQTSIKWHGTEA